LPESDGKFFTCGGIIMRVQYKSKIYGTILFVLFISLVLLFAVLTLIEQFTIAGILLASLFILAVYCLIEPKYHGIYLQKDKLKIVKSFYIRAIPKNTIERIIIKTACFDSLESLLLEINYKNGDEKLFKWATILVNKGGTILLELKVDIDYIYSLRDYLSKEYQVTIL
jgi:hypothetical protein